MYLDHKIFNSSFYEKIAIDFNTGRGYKNEVLLNTLNKTYFDISSELFKNAQTYVPSWIVSDESKPTIMVIAQDALRSAKDKKDFDSNTLLINTPFSLQGSEERDCEK